MTDLKLIVKSPFRDYRKGDQILEPQEVKKILECHEHKMVVKTPKNARDL